MPDFAAMLSPDRVVDLDGTTKEEVLRELCAVLATSDRVTDPEDLVRSILARERDLSTGVGIGIALPHVKIASIKDFAIAVGRSFRGIDFQSIDDKPVHIIVMIGCNAGQSGDYIKVLSRFVRALKDEAFRKKLLAAPSREQVAALLLEATGKA